MTAAAQLGKAMWEKHGAERFMLNFVVAGPDSGQWALVILFTSWDAFGKAMQSATADPAFHEFMAAMDAATETVSRRLLMGVDL